MATYLFNHTKKGDGQKRVFADSKIDFREEDYSDIDLIPVDLLKYIDEEEYRDLKTLDDNSPFKKRNNVQKL